MENIAYIYQPHFKTSMFRVAVNKQQSKDTNYIVVTCSPQYNGVWKYSGDIHYSCDRWINGKTACYEIPISSCTFVKSLNEIVPIDKRRMVINQQKEWLKNEVKNRNYSYSEIPDWMMKEIKDELNVSQ